MRFLRSFSKSAPGSAEGSEAVDERPSQLVMVVSRYEGSRGYESHQNAIAG